MKGEANERKESSMNPKVTYYSQEFGLGLILVLGALFGGVLLAPAITDSLNQTVDGNVAPQIISTLFTVEAVFLGFVVVVLQLRYQGRHTLIASPPNFVILAAMAVFGYLGLREGLVDLSKVDPSSKYPPSFFGGLIFYSIEIILLVGCLIIVGVIVRLLVQNTKWFIEPYSMRPSKQTI